MRTEYIIGSDVELAIKIVDNWHLNSCDMHKIEPEGLKLARLIIQRGNEVTLTSTQKAAPELLEACKAFQQATSNYRTYGQRGEFDYCKYLSQVEGQINLAIENATNP